MCLQLLPGKVAPAIAGQYPRNNNNKQNQNKNNNNDNNYNNSRLISSTYFNQLFRLFKFRSTLQFKTDDEFRSRLWNMTKFSSPSLLLRHLRPRKKVRKNRIFGLKRAILSRFFLRKLAYFDRKRRSAYMVYEVCNYVKERLCFKKHAPHNIPQSSPACSPFQSTNHIWTLECTWTQSLYTHTNYHLYWYDKPPRPKTIVVAIWRQIRH